MTPAVTTTHNDGVTIVSLEGSAGVALFARLQAEILPACSSRPVVLDITSLTIAGSDAFRQLTAFLHWASETLSHVGLVCRRLSARRLLHRSGAAEVVPVFMTVEEAVEALGAQGPAAVPAASAPVGAADSGGRSGPPSPRRTARAKKKPAAPRYASPMGGEV